MNTSLDTGRLPHELPHPNRSQIYDRHTLPDAEKKRLPKPSSIITPSGESQGAAIFDD